MSRVKIGTVGVDTGMVMLIDPCNVIGSDAGMMRFKGKWHQFCDKMFGRNSGDGGSYSFKNGWKPGTGLAVIVPTAYGDGEYPVYAEIEDGRIVSLTIEFDDQTEREEEKEREEDEQKDREDEVSFAESELEDKNL